MFLVFLLLASLEQNLLSLQIFFMPLSAKREKGAYNYLQIKDRLHGAK